MFIFFKTCNDKMRSKDRINFYTTCGGGDTTAACRRAPPPRVPTGHFGSRCRIIDKTVIVSLLKFKLKI